jgi:putative Mg2+ transporter-C (MgtC) family protein
LFVRVLLAAALGALVGFEREISGQPAGFRTHILVSLGAALFTLVGVHGVEVFGGVRDARLDPTRVAAQVVTGIGFLGAGAIIQQGVSVRGLTTAASLWVTAAIGTAMGLGYWEGAVLTSLVTVVALYGLKPVGHRVFRRLRREEHRFFVEIQPHLRLSDLAKVTEEIDARTESIRLFTDDDENQRVIVVVRLPPNVRPDVVVDLMRRVDGVTSVTLEH